MKLGRSLVAVVAIVCTPIAAAQAQEESPAPVTPLELQVSLARYRGEQAVSNLPYVLSLLSLNPPARGNAKLRMGVEVPVQVGDSGGIQYRNVGTNIDCSTSMPLASGAFEIACSIEHSSVYGPEEETREPTPDARFASVPAFRTFRIEAAGILRDGERKTFSSATDPVSGEVLKVEVALKVLK